MKRVFFEVVVAARAHTCVECQGAISPREEYAKLVGRLPPKQIGWRTVYQSEPLHVVCVPKGCRRRVEPTKVSRTKGAASKYQAAKYAELLNKIDSLECAVDATVAETVVRRAVSAAIVEIRTQLLSIKKE